MSSRERARYEKRVGTVVNGRWRIDSLLGWGSTSAVYAATHRNGSQAALKILHLSLCADQVVGERFLREAGIANTIKHRAIVPIRDDGTTEDGCAYLVLDLLEGETLDARRERNEGRLAIEDFAPVAEELMAAIAAVHAAGVVHRDLKPQNVFLTKAGDLKLLDFGTARIFDNAMDSRLSMQGLISGTPAFMSPEQARGSRDEVDAQSDVWSLGAMIFTVLSGEYVHAGRNAHDRLLAAASKPARKLSDLAPSVDDRVATVVDRALGYAKAERWPDVQAMRVAFRNAIIASVPTMRNLKVLSAVREEEEEDEAAPGTLSLSDPSVATARDAPAAEASVASAPSLAIPAAPHSESEAPGVSSTQGIPRVAPGIPLSALVMGCAAMAAVVFLVVFFLAGGDESTRSAAVTPAPIVKLAAPENAAPGSPAPSVAPAASFIVISAPDEPVPEAEKPPVVVQRSSRGSRGSSHVPVARSTTPATTARASVVEASPTSPEPDVAVLATPAPASATTSSADAGVTGPGGATIEAESKGAVPASAVPASANDVSLP